VLAFFGNVSPQEVKVPLFVDWEKTLNIGTLGTLARLPRNLLDEERTTYENLTDKSL